jgi:hypothetical protein
MLSIRIGHDENERFTIQDDLSESADSDLAIIFSVVDIGNDRMSEKDTGTCQEIESAFLEGLLTLVRVPLKFHIG